ncbi:hypothetical protein F5Y11DRAFT_363825 [Daldinia sp. FL1419]|nr:hypothetical protein F5Y11DRAFT_363825 [Daldinia sp. FL1419]
MALHHPHSKPVPFTYYADDQDNLPNLSDAQFEDVESLLRGLAKAMYPRLEAVPTTLNLYNCYRIHDDDADNQPWAYFAPILSIPEVPANENARAPKIPPLRLDEGIRDDLERPWRTLRNRGRQDEPAQDAFRRYASYRFVCFIHRHSIKLKNIAQRAVHTISIWDREWDELTWHDTYHMNREKRRDEIRQFWRLVDVRELTDMRKDDFMRQLRYRTVYHTCRNLEETLRNYEDPPPHTHYTDMAIRNNHMNNARELHVSIVPDRLDTFGGQNRDLLPRFFAHLVWVSLAARPEWLREDQVKHLAQFAMVDRVPWMRRRVREFLESYCERYEGGDLDPGGREWVLDALKL